MVYICGLSYYEVSFFHLINHAFFKALLFLSAGSVIHAIAGEQDMRKFGSLIKLIPFTYSMMLVGFLALSGFPFLSGFYSKDLILEVSFSSYSVMGIFSNWLGTMVALLTAFYSFRVVYYTFFSKFNGFKFYIQQTHELLPTMGFALVVLFFGSMFSGFLLKDMFVGFGNTFWNNSIFKSNFSSVALDFEFIPIFIKNIPLFFSLTGIVGALIWNFFWFSFKKVYYGWFAVWCKDVDNLAGSNYSIFTLEIYRFLSNEWYFNSIYNYYLGYSILDYSYDCFYKLLDKSLIEFLMPQGFSKVTAKLSNILITKQISFIYHTGCLLVLNLLFLISFILLF